MSRRTLLLLPCIVIITILGVGIIKYSEDNIETVIQKTIGDEFTGNAQGAVENQLESALIEERAKAPTIRVDVKGEVKRPNVYELPRGSIVNDAIEAAGGHTEQADIMSINRARLLEDGEQVIIESSSKEEEPLGEPQAVADDGYININTATATQLKTLPGVGEVTAKRIIEYREKEGSFKNIEEIKKVSGIGEKRFEQIKDLIKV